jgi:hypothetical protein
MRVSEDDEEFVSEAECAVCAQWPSALRLAMRCAVNVLPLKEPVCGGCLQAFWTNITAKADAKREQSS